MARKMTLEPSGDAMHHAADAFFQLLYVDHDFIAAMTAHTTPTFIEHNPNLPNSPEEQAEWFAERSAANPEFFAPKAEWKTRFVHHIIAGNYLIVHYFMSVGPDDRGRMFADFWRFDGDKIIEHWDVVQPVPKTIKSGNPMW